MDKKTLIAVAIVAILIIAAAGAYAVNNNKSKSNEPSALADAELKVFGNINGDRYVNQDDVDLIQKLVNEGKSAADYPLADAWKDGVLDQKDVDNAKKIATGQKTTVWHVNYHDTDGDGTMDEEIVSTQFPIKSVIITASSNTALLLYSLGIVDEVKGASYSSLDAGLFSNSYLDTDKVVKLGKSSTTITFEDGKAGSSDVIAEQGVTAVISDWNRTYITNESAFESAGIDVVRVAAASIDREVMTHSALLIGLLFQKMSRAVQYLDTSFQVMDYVESALQGADPVKAVASSMTGYFSSGESDYTETLVKAGAVFGASNVDFGGSASAKIADHPEFNTSDCQYVIHIRTALGYAQDAETIESNYETYCAAYSTWQHAEDGQYMISGTIPVALRIAYAAAAMHPDLVDVDKVDRYHQVVVDKLYDDVDFDISEMIFLVTPETFA